VNTAFRLETAINNNNHSTAAKTIATPGPVWPALLALYSAFRGSTLVVRSEGLVAAELGDVLGVYRLVDTHQARPLYKQDQGENYIYFSSGTGCWYAGTVVGLQHAWLRHPAPGGEVWPPDLGPAWQHRTGTAWSTEDTTLRVEALPDVERIRELLESPSTAM